MTRAQEIADRLKTLPAQTSLEVTHGLTLRKTANGVNVGRLHYSAHPERDPELHPEWKTAERKAYPSQAAWDREQEIVDEAGGGELVFADVLVTHWDKIVIEDPEGLPTSWTPGWKSSAVSTTAKLTRLPCCAPTSTSMARSSTPESITCRAGKSGSTHRR